MKIILFADTHNNLWFRRIVEKFKNEDYHLISLGDIAAVETKEFLRREEIYRKTWKYKRTGKGRITKENEKWFDNLNIVGWNNQMKILDEFKKKLTICLGNSDHAMLSWYKLKMSEYLSVISEITLMRIGEVSLIFLPYSSGSIKQRLFEELKGAKIVYVLSHCPPMKETEKKYYKEIYNNITKLSETVDKVVSIHGHMHPDQTYKYNLKDLDNVEVYAIKSTDTKKGFGSYNHAAVIDSISERIQFIDLELEKVTPKKLPKKYYTKDKHWNKF